MVQKRRIEGDIKVLSNDINIMEKKKKGELRNRDKFELLNKKYNVMRKGITKVIEELKQRVLAKAATIKRYEQRATQYKKNVFK